MTASPPAAEVTAAQVLARRFAAQGLDRSAKAAEATDLPGWSLGFQDSPAGEAFAARLSGGAKSVPDLRQEGLRPGR